MALCQRVTLPFVAFLVEWYSIDKHALITLDSGSNVKGSVDLDFIMKVYK